MSDITTTINDASVELQVRTLNRLRSFLEGQMERMREERGQTAAEYLGVLVVVSVIIALVSQTQVGKEISDSISTVVGKIAGGESAKK
jgi:pilus assembly protein Flp/PilA